MKKYLQTITYEYKAMLSDFRWSYMRYIKYQLITKFLIGIIMIPTFKLILSYILRSRGRTSVYNGLLLKYLVTPQGIISIIITLLLAISVVLIEVGGLIIISHQVYTKEKESRYDTIVLASLKHFKNLVGTGGLLILFYVLILTPWLDIGYQTSLITTIEIPGFILDYINQNTTLWVIHSVLFIVLIFASIRWIFSLHLIMLDNKSAWKAIKGSKELVVKHWKKFLGLTIGVNGLLLLVALLLFIVMCIIGFGIIALINIKTDVTVIAFVGFFGLTIVYIFAISFIILPIEVHLFTRLYYGLSEKTVTPLNLKSKKNHGNKLDTWLAKPKVITGMIITGMLIAASITAYILYDMEEEKIRVQVTAHRGSSVDAPENTLAAIKIAMDHKADFVEIDVQETEDGQLILLHDSSFKRTTGVDEIPGDMTLKEIKTLDAGSWFDAIYADEKVPTLQEVIDLAKGNIRLNIEIKGTGDDENLIKKVIQTIRENNLMQSCVVTSLDYEIIQGVEAIEPSIKTGYIMYVAIGDLKDVNVDFYSVEMSNVNEKFIAKAHLLGREVHVWTVNNEGDMESMLLLGVDNIITDYDALLRDVIKQLKEDPWSRFIQSTISLMY